MLPNDTYCLPLPTWKSAFATNFCPKDFQWEVAIRDVAEVWQKRQVSALANKGLHLLEGSTEYYSLELLCLNHIVDTRRLRCSGKYPN